MRFRQRQLDAERFSAGAENSTGAVPSALSTRETILRGQEESLDRIFPIPTGRDFVNSDNPVEKNSAVSSPRWLFVLARIYLGISFLFSDHGNARPNELAGFLKFALKNGYGWYQNLLNSVVVPHSSTFGTFVVIAEIYIGIALVLGFTTRLAALLALFFCS